MAQLHLTDEGFAKAEQMLGGGSVQPAGPLAHYITNALKAKELFVKDVNYIVRDGEAVIVDEFTGRVMPGRRWSDGAPGDRSQGGLADSGRDPDPRLDHISELLPALSSLAGMTGTAKTEEVEFEKTHKLETTIVPTNWVRPARTGLIRCTNRKRQMASRRRRNSRDPQERPAGTRGHHVNEKSELPSSLLAEQEIPHNLLNAKPENVERESEIVAQAGRAGAVNIATNMAGRGTDIILGGNSDYMARLKLREVLLGRLVKPEDVHKPSVQLQRITAAGGFADAVTPTLPRSGESLYPCPHRRHRSSPGSASP